MKQTLILVLSIIPVFVFIYFFQFFLGDYFQVNNKKFTGDFYIFITATALLMLLSLLFSDVYRPKYTGFVFLAWSMLKIILVMAYFVWFVMRLNLQLDNNSIFYIVSLYLFYLFYEVIFTVILLRKNNR